jgi:uncharacterized protein (TIGR03435 family)
MAPVVSCAAMKTTLCALLMGSLALAATPEFDVASVRPTPPSKEHGLSLGFRMDAAGMHIGALTLREIIAAAYRLKPYQVRGPEWTETERFDINATLPPGARADQIPEMLQALLAERFGLVVHREKKEMPVYALLIGKPPLRVQQVPAAPVPASAGVVNGTLTGGPAGVFRDFGNGSSYSFAGGTFEGKKLTMAVLATELERYADRPLVELTELKGTYDVRFNVPAEDFQVLLRRAAVNSGMAVPSQIMRAIDNDVNPLPQAVSQVGLQLDGRRMSVELLVVDDVRRVPVEN